MKKANLMLSVAAISVLALTGCNDSDDRVEADATATFKDSVVQGLAYTCIPSNVTGVTDVKGKLTCRQGDKAEFRLGAMKFGPVAVRENDVITPYRIFPDDNEAAVNLAQLIQSLDDDGHYDEVITIDLNKLKAVTINLDPTSPTFDTDAAAMLSDYNSSLVLVSEEDAEAHMNAAIADTVAPIVTLQGEKEVRVALNTSYTDAGAVANDNIHGMMTPVMSGSVNTAVPGTYTITWMATDAAGNVGSETRTVIVEETVVEDTTPPVVTLVGDATVHVAQGTTYVDAGATANDNVDGAITAVMSGSVNTEVPGTYTITWMATDAAGNEGTATRTVIVDEAGQSTPTTQEELEASEIGDTCTDENGDTGTVAKDMDPFGNVIPGTATCEVSSEPIPTTQEELEASEIGDTCIDENGDTGTVAKDMDPFGNIIPGSATCSVAN